MEPFGIIHRPEYGFLLETELGTFSHETVLEALATYKSISPVPERRRVKQGDVVLFTSRGSADGKFPSTTFPLIVVKAHNIENQHGSIVDGWTMNPRGQRYEENVLCDPSGDPGTWYWPESN